MFTAPLFIIAKTGGHQMPVNRRIDKKIVIYSHNGIQYSKKKNELQLHKTTR